MNSHTFIFFGLQGSGKGTQIKLLIDLLNSRGINTAYAYPGGEFRKMTESGTYTGNLLKVSLDKGELQPDYLSTTVFTNILTEHMREGTAIIADGYPRTVVQAENFENMMKFYGRTDMHIISLELSREEAITRNMKRGRADDTEEGLSRRLQWHEENVIPAMNHLKSKSGYTFHSINGEQSVEAVHADIIRALNL